MDVLHNFGMRITYPEALKLFATVDGNMDGGISEREFIDVFMDMIDRRKIRDPIK